MSKTISKFYQIKKKIFKGCRFVEDLIIHFAKDFSTYFIRAFKARLFFSYSYHFLRSLIDSLNHFRIYLYEKGIEYFHIKENQIKKLKTTAKGLHSLLPYNEIFTYSILIPVQSSKEKLFKETLESAVHQSAPHLEIIIGLMIPPTKQMETIIHDLSLKHEGIIKTLNISHLQNKGSAINKLAQESKGNYLLVLDQEDWLRPDCLLRFEQMLRIYPKPENLIVYCNLNALSQVGYFIPNSEIKQPSELHFPYFFKTMIEKGFLFPSALWKKCQGLNCDLEGCEWEDLLLKMHCEGASFQPLPLALYSIRGANAPKKEKNQDTFIKVLKKYSIQKKLKWEWTAGYHPHTARAHPAISQAAIQVVIPFKDQKQLTLACVHSLLNQKDVKLRITAIDNGSQDRSIGQEIESLGGEVIRVDEPFNYSRINNLAVKMSKKGQDCPLILFINNDVELEHDAVAEMARWIEQPTIGMVGCRLHYPDGRLQHGGVALIPNGKSIMRWDHVEKLRTFEEMNLTKSLGFFDAVTAACMMIKKEIFLDVGGFDEIWTPIGYSDTHLATKLKKKGLKCFYTPYAVGIHHESVSRQTAIEDFESSQWLHDLLMNRPLA